MSSRLDSKTRIGRTVGHSYRKTANQATGKMFCVRTDTLVLLLVAIVLSGHLEWTEGHRERQKRTIGGSSFSRGEFPFLALLKATVVTRRFLGVVPIDHYHLYCGGVLITDRWLLSAAHCFSDTRAARRASNWEARLGTVRLRAGIRERVLDVIGRITTFNELRNWEVDVDRIVVHPAYNTTGILSNDIALIKLSRSIPRRRVSTLIQPIPLPGGSRQNFPNQIDECVTMGWGCTAPGQGPSRHARQIPMPIRPASTCNYHYSLQSMVNRVCAGYTNGGIGVCQGDSGSPLVCKIGHSYRLAGLVSLTSRNRPESFPAVFTSIRDYLPWIQEVIGEDQEQLNYL